MFNFLRNYPELFSKVTVSFPIPSRKEWGSNFSTSYPTLVIVHLFFYYSHPKEVILSGPPNVLVQVIQVWFFHLVSPYGSYLGLQIKLIKLRIYILSWFSTDFYPPNYQEESCFNNFHGHNTYMLLFAKSNFVLSADVQVIKRIPRLK